MTAFLYQGRRSTRAETSNADAICGKSQIPNPKSQIPTPKFKISCIRWDLGFGIWVLGFLHDQIGVACEHPTSVRLLPQDLQCVARPVHGGALFRREGEVDVVSNVGPI